MKIVYFSRRVLYIIIFTLIIGLIIYFLYPISQLRKENSNVIIMGFNDLGMHCIQPDYSKFFILPPGNNIKIQVFKKGTKSELITKGIRVKYKVNNQNDPTKYSNFWDYADKYGYKISRGVGITGNALTGFMKLDSSGRYWEATAIPVTSLTGGTGSASPYKTATITVFDENNNVLGELKELVIPVSPEMDCLNCHKTWDNILKAHDNLEATKLFSESEKGTLHRCNECHPDPILKQAGKTGLPSLSLAMHDFHASKMTGNINPVCINCHPGVKTDCYRGVMKAKNITCINCHGNMSEVAKSIKEGRTPWLEEPKCQKCHKQIYQTNQGQLYQNSYLLNSPGPDMNNIILCGSCHNSSHAEWPSLLEIDNLLPLKLQGEPTFIKKCSVCHTDKNGKVHN